MPDTFVPTDTLCPVCSTIFVQSVRAQGGGKRGIYCSSRCRSLDWARGNGAKRKAAILKYETKPENKEKKRLRQKLARFARYGWTEATFLAELARQNYSCYGCLTPIDTQTACIDHCHTTDRVRGLLCGHCNWGLGHLQDAPAVLRRLMAYVERDRTKTLVYVGGALKNQRIPEIGNTLRAEGYDVMDEWYTPGPDADTNWQAYEKLRGRSYADALRGRAATNIFLFDRSYIDMCDAFVLVLPAGKSSLLELGYAGGRGKRTCLFLDGQEPERYDVMPTLADIQLHTENQLVGWLKAQEGV